MTKLRQVIIDIYYLTLGGPAGGLVVTTGIESNPAAAEYVHAANLVP